MYRRVAIIGGGAASVSLLSELVERPRPRTLRLDWYTGGSSPGRGVAYSTTSDRHLLNVRAESMRLFSGRPRGFLDFAQNVDSAVRSTDCLPRHCYGEYLRAEVEHALQQARAHGHDVNVIPFAADAIMPETDSVTIVRGEEVRTVDEAVLASGALPPQPLAEVDAAALQSGLYVVDPWLLLGSVDASVAPRRVVVIGSGLTAADVVVELAARWPDAHFNVISRHGRWPERHLPKASASSGDHVALIESLRQEPDVRQWLRRLREAIADEPDWRSVIDSLRSDTPQLWGQLPTAQRARFLRHARSSWERARHRLPPAVASTLDVLEQSGRLRRREGRVRAVNLTGGRLQLTYAHGSAMHALETDLIIQSTGLETDVRRAPHRLLDQLHTAGYLSVDKQGLGIQATAAGCVTHAGGHWSRLLVIGSLLRGTLWECSAMPEIQRQARTIADHLLRD